MRYNILVASALVAATAIGTPALARDVNEATTDRPAAVSQDIHELRVDNKELRDDKRELREDRRELRGDRRELREQRKEVREHRREMIEQDAKKPGRDGGHRRDVHKRRPHR